MILKHAVFTWLKGAQQARRSSRDAVAFLQHITDNITDASSCILPFHTSPRPLRGNNPFLLHLEKHLRGPFDRAFITIRSRQSFHLKNPTRYDRPDQ